MLEIDLEITPVKQVGMICKLVAVAAIDKYYAKKFNFSPIPLYKDHGSHPVSIRQIAKNGGSLQGEVLEIGRLQKVFSELGYDTELIDFQSDPAILNEKIRDNLLAGNVPISFFAVDCDTGLPGDVFDGINEHCAIISGCNGEENIQITHWDKHYRTSIEEFYTSSLALPRSRDVEYYEPTFNVGSLGKGTKKYNMITEQTLMDSNRPFVRFSITPEENTGFQGKLLIVKKPDITKIKACRALLYNAENLAKHKDRRKAFQQSHNIKKIGQKFLAILQTLEDMSAEFKLAGQMRSHLAAETLYNDLASNFFNLKDANENFTRKHDVKNFNLECNLFKERCLETINKTKLEIKQCRRCQDFFVDLSCIIFSIATCGLANLASRALTGRYTFFSQNTESQWTLNAIKPEVCHFVYQ